MTLVTTVWILAAIATAIVLLRVTAPYGRHARAGWGPALPAAIGWVVMESPSLLVMTGLFLASPRRVDPAAQVFVTLWAGHYVYRSLVFPWLGAQRKADVPISIVASGAVFNVINATLNGVWLFFEGPRRDASWLRDPRFVGGIALFATGFWVHASADAGLRALRARSATRYAIPRGGLFERVSCPNYLGEIVEWSGFAILTWSLTGLSFAVWTASNLVPRAVAHHRWYRETFPDYPTERKAVVPGLL